MICVVSLVCLFVLSCDGFGVRNSMVGRNSPKMHGRMLSNPDEEDRTKWLTTVPEKWGVDCVAGSKLNHFFLQDLSINAFSNGYAHYQTGYHTTYDVYDILVEQGFLSSYNIGIGLYGDKISSGSSSLCSNIQAKLGTEADFYNAYMEFGSTFPGQPAGALLENLYFVATNAGFAEGDAGKEVNQVVTVFTDEKYQFSESIPTGINLTSPGKCMVSDHCDCPGPYYDHDTAAAPFIGNHISLGIVVLGDTDLYNWYVDQVNSHRWSNFTTVQQVPASVGDWFWADWESAWRCDWTPSVNCSGAALEIEFVVSLLPNQDYPAFEYYRNVLPQCMLDLSAKFNLTLGFSSTSDPVNDTCFKTDLPTTADMKTFSDFIAAVPHYDGRWVNNGFVNGSSIDAVSFNLNNRDESRQVSPLTGRRIQIVIPITFEYLSFSTNLSQTIETKASANGAGVGPKCSNPSVDINRWSNQMINNHIYYTPLVGERWSNENLQSLANEATENRFSDIYVKRGMFRYESALCHQIWSVVDEVACRLEPSLAQVPVQAVNCSVTLPSIYVLAENAVIAAKGTFRDNIGEAAEYIGAAFPGSNFAYHEFSSRDNKTFCAEYNTIPMSTGKQLRTSLDALTLVVDSYTGVRASALDAIRYATDGHKDGWKGGKNILFLFVQNPSHVAGDGSPVSGMQQSFEPNDGGCNGDYLDLIPTINAMKSVNVSVAVAVIDSDRNNDTLLYWSRLSKLVETPMKVFNLAGMDDFAGFISDVVFGDFCVDGCPTPSTHGQLVLDIPDEELVKFSHLV